MLLHSFVIFPFADSPIAAPRKRKGPSHDSVCLALFSAYRLWWPLALSATLVSLVTLDFVLLPAGGGACLPGQQAQAPPDGWH